MSRGVREKEDGGNPTSSYYYITASGWLVKRGDAQWESAKCNSAQDLSRQEPGSSVSVPR